MKRILLLMTIVHFNLNAQSPFTAGTFFGSTLPISYSLTGSPPSPAIVDQIITVIAVDSTCVLFKSSDSNLDSTFELHPGQVRKLKFCSTLPYFSTPQTYRGFTIHSSGRVNVFSSISELVTTDSCSNHLLEMFADVGGVSHVPGGHFKNVFIAPPPSSEGVAGSVIWVVTIKSHFDSNNITIKPHSNVMVNANLLIPFWLANGSYDTLLNKDQCFQFELDNNRASIDSTRPRPNGSILSSANNLSFDVVISQIKGLHYNCPPTNYLQHPVYLNFLTGRFFTPQLSIESADTLFHLPRYSSGCREELYDFTSLYDGNRIFVNGVLTRILDSNEIFRYRLSSPSVVKSDFGLLGGVRVVYDSAITNTHLGGWSAVAQSDRFAVKRSQFSTLRNWDTTMRHFAMVNIPTSDTSTFRHNGLKSNAPFSTYPSDNKWGYYKIELDTGVHVLSSTKGFYGMYYNFRQAPNAPADTLNFNFVRSKEVGNYNQCFPLPESIPSQKTELAFSVRSQGQQLLIRPADTLTLCMTSVLQIQTGTQWGNQWSASFGDGTDTLVSTYGVPHLFSHNYAQTGVYTVNLEQGHFCDSIQTTFYVKVIEAAQADFRIDTTWECNYIELQLTSTANTATEWFWNVNGQQSAQPIMRVRLPYRDTTISILHRTLLGNCMDSTLRTLTFAMSSDTLNGLGNLVTPNSDGINDKLCLPDELRSSSDPCFRWQIFNRWGTSVFQTDQPKDCWEPERTASSGVYYSIINVLGKVYRNTFTLTR